MSIQKTNETRAIMEELDQLLDEVSFKMGTLREARNRFSAQLVPEFRIFDYLRTDEMGLSMCIASLLNPNGTHGQGRVFLAAFLKKIGSASAWATTTENCRVILEKQANGQRRIDIYLDFQMTGVIGIENKPWAGDQDQQLADYATFIKKEAGNKKWLLIYLSNSDPSQESIKASEREMLEESGQFVRLTYANVIEWLNDCACQSKALVVRVFVEELAKFIRMDINGELDMSEEQEMKNVILKSLDNLKSAFHVLSAMNSVKQDLLAVFKSDLERKLNAEGFDLAWDPSMSNRWKSCVGFGVKVRKGKTQDKYLRFEFSSPGLDSFFWGIRRDNASVAKADVIWREINDVMKSLFGTGKNSEWWPWHSVLPDHEFGTEFTNWQNGEMPWVFIKDERMAEKITALAVRVHKAFSDANQLHLLFEVDSGTSITHPGLITP